MNLNVKVKDEPAEKLDEPKINKEYADLYENHVIKDELVIGPEMICGEVLAESTNNKIEYDFKVGFKMEFEKALEDKVPKLNIEVKIEREDSTEEYAEKTVRHKRNKKSKLATNRKIFCTCCPQQFASKISLIRHMTVHKNGKKYACELCDRKFIANWNLKQHMRSHNKLKYECDICHEFIADHSRYRSHLRAHSGVTKERKNKKETFVCDICNKTFFAKKYLTRHIQEHAPNRFLCHICSKSFSRRENLNAHLCRHENKIFYCGICSKGFMRDVTAKMHEKKCKTTNAGKANGDHK